MTGSAGRFLGFGNHTSGTSSITNCTFQGVFLSSQNRCSIGFDFIVGTVNIIDSLYSA
jgi:hypothetical protein